MKWLLDPLPVLDLTPLDVACGVIAVLAWANEFRAVLEAT